MEVMVDGARFSFAEPPKDVIGAVAAVSERLQQQGRSIMRVNVDGQPLDPASLVEVLSKKPIDAVRTLSFESESVAKLVEESLRELESVLPELSKACHELAAIFQGADPQSGYEPFEQLAEIWSHVKTRQSLIANALDMNLDTLTINGKSVSAAHDELNGFLAEAAGALESGDLVLLGDLLEYELAPRAETEVAITALLRERIGG